MRDELLIRFVDGKATPEEVEQVLRELSQDGYAAKEWIQMHQGSVLAGTPPFQEISSEEFIAKTLAMASARTGEKTKHVRLPWLIGGLTAVAASVAMIISVLVNDGGHNPDIDILAYTNDTTNIEQPVELAGRKILQEDMAASAFQNTTQLFEMVMPPETPYQISYKSSKKDFVFEWNANGVTSVRFYISDEEGHLLIDKSQILGNNCAIALPDIAGKGLLTWTAEVMFNDGMIRKFFGKLELISAE